MAVYNLSLTVDLYQEYPERLRQFIGKNVIKQLVAALFTGELGSGEDRGLIIDGQAVTSENDILNLEMNTSGAVDPIFAILNEMDVFPTDVAEVDLPSLEE
ncbi:MAG: hypothetical protein L3J16_03175 [Anaerolineales bacterium]|nr:hypothetical protein [Anaerolineales bacterium]